MLDDQIVRIHKSVYTILYARLLVAVEPALGDLRGDALLEAHHCEIVDA